jgi:hypothetical protein
MTDKPLERYLDDFGRMLKDAGTKAPSSDRQRRPRWGRHRRAMAGAAIALAAAVVLAVLLSLPGGGRHLDVVAEARAALGQPGQLVHLVVRQSNLPPPGAKHYKVPPPSTSEQWSTSAPPRWRLAFSYPDPKKQPGGGTVGDAHGPIVGAVQVAYADGVQSTYYQERNTLRRISGFADNGPAATVPGATPLGNDPIATIRGMLARHQLQDAGEATVAGRVVHRLLGERTRRFGKESVTTTVEYDVAPDTFAPVQARVELPLPVRATGLPARNPSIVLRFLTFERLPLTPVNRRLLEIQPVGRPTVTDTSVSKHRPKR